MKKENQKQRAIRNYAGSIMEEINEALKGPHGFEAFESYLNSTMEDFYEDVIELEGIKGANVK